MTKQADLRRTWKVDRNKWHIKLYVWLYGDPSSEGGKDSVLTNLTFCKWFWGVVLSPFALFAVGVLSLFAAVANIGADKRAAKRLAAASAEDEPEKPKVTKAQRQHKWLSAMVAGVAWFFDKIASFFQAIGVWQRKHDRFMFVVKTVLSGLLVIAVIGGVAYGLYAWVSFGWKSFVEFVKFFGLFLAILASGFAIVALAAYFSDSLGRAFEWLYDHPLTAIGHGFRGVGRFFAFGYHAVKTRTCPRVEVI